MSDSPAEPAGMMSPSALVTGERRGTTGVLMLDDPTRRNMLSEDVVAGIDQHISAFEQDPEVRCIIVTGRGSAFCAGAPLTVLEAAARDDFSVARRVYDAFLRVEECPLPTIAAVNGPALGAGFNLAMACDLVLSSELGWFQSRYPAMNLHPGGGHLWLLQRAVGPAAARAIGLFDARVTAAEAQRLGLVWEVLAIEELMPRAEELAGALASRDPDYLRTLKSSTAEAWNGMTYRAAVQAEEERQRVSVARPAFLTALSRLQSRITR
jgi:enoyl-CoA hydratase